MMDRSCSDAHLVEGLGNDWLSGGSGADCLEGSSGTDTADYSDSTGQSDNQSQRPLWSRSRGRRRHTL
ncbi:hypothetical protein JQ506_15970 [Shinella sp. PSBB067]|nr:hypothetical protein JQ506_15970 [Shinella sp. PSBB067]